MRLVSIRNWWRFDFESFELCHCQQAMWEYFLDNRTLFPIILDIVSQTDKRASSIDPAYTSLLKMASLSVRTVCINCSTLFKNIEGVFLDSVFDKLNMIAICIKMDKNSNYLASHHSTGKCLSYFTNHRVLVVFSWLLVTLGQAALILPLISFPRVWLVWMWFYLLVSK